MKPSENKLSIDEARQKIASYCAYQERCHLEVKTRLYSFGLFSAQVDELIAWLITENFLNEERYAITIAGGKFRMNQWGRRKIVHLLKSKQVSDYSIQKATEAIDPKDYRATLQKLIMKRIDNLNEASVYLKRDKIAHYLVNKGYEPDLIWEELRTIILK